MAFDKTQLPQQSRVQDITSALGAGSATISTATAYKCGSEMVIELDLSNSTTTYIKVKTGKLKVGGTSGQ